jgi:hypothetical protein
MGNARPVPAGRRVGDAHPTRSETRLIADPTEASGSLEERDPLRRPSSSDGSRFDLPEPGSPA